MVATSSSPRRPIILLVDDDADTLEMYQMGLACAGFSPVGISDAASVARQVTDLHPDAVVTDLQLHGTTGWRVMQSIKEHSRGRLIPVVLLTGYSSADIDEQAQSLGCAAVLTKPCTPDELGEVLRRVLAPVGVPSRAPGSAKGRVAMADGFDAPLEDRADYEQ